MNPGGEASGSQYLGLKFMGSTLNTLGLGTGHMLGHLLGDHLSLLGNHLGFLAFFEFLLSTLQGTFSPMFE